MGPKFFTARVLLVSALWLAVSALSAPSVAALSVTEKTLSNGLKLIVAEDHTSPLAVFQIWYRVGSRHEEAGKSGTSHLLEHMMFKGTPSHGPTEFSRAVKRLGGGDNAFTSKEYTGYYQELPSKDISLSFKMESDRMQNLLLDEAEVLQERKVVMEERRLRYEDDPQNSLFESLIATAFMVHPYRWPVIGWMSDLETISRDDLTRHYRKYYAPDNAFIVVAGDVEPGDMLALAEEYFGPIAPGPGLTARAYVEPRQRGERRVLLKREVELPYVAVAYHVPTLFEEDGYALDILSEVLTGKSGRLYRSMVYNDRVALSADAGYLAAHTEPFMFYLEATAAPDKSAPDIEQALYGQIERIISSPPSEFEMQKAKNGLEASFVMGQDSIMNQAMLIGRFEIARSWRLKDEYIPGIRAVTAEDVTRVAAKYFTAENRTVGVLIPIKPKGATAGGENGEVPKNNPKDEK